jgi:hypothetical protein
MSIVKPFYLPHVDPNCRYPASEVERVWERTLLFQFHDVLPGSAIKMVYDTTAEEYPKYVTGFAVTSFGIDERCSSSTSFLPDRPHKQLSFTGQALMLLTTG